MAYDAEKEYQALKSTYKDMLAGIVLLFSIVGSLTIYDNYLDKVQMKKDYEDKLELFFKKAESASSLNIEYLKSIKELSSSQIEIEKHKATIEANKRISQELDYFFSTDRIETLLKRNIDKRMIENATESVQLSSIISRTRDGIYQGYKQLQRFIVESGDPILRKEAKSALDTIQNEYFQYHKARIENIWNKNDSIFYYPPNYYDYNSFRGDPRSILHVLEDHKEDLNTICTMIIILNNLYGTEIDIFDKQEAIKYIRNLID